MDTGRSRPGMKENTLFTKSKFTKILRWRQTLETTNENELLIPEDFFSTGAENIQLLPFISQVFWLLTF